MPEWGVSTRMSTQEEFARKIRAAGSRYDTASVSTWDLITAIRGVIGKQFSKKVAADVLDVIRTILAPRDVTLRDAVIATLLVGEDYEVPDIVCACTCLQNGAPALTCVKVKPEHQDMLDELVKGTT